MTARPFLYPVRTASGAQVATLRYEAHDATSARFEWLDDAGALVLDARIGGPGATRLFDAAGRELPVAGAHAASPAAAAMQAVASSAVMRSCHPGGRPAWIIDDYENRSRHLIFGCAPDLFLNVHLDHRGTLTVTEKTRCHATLRCVRRDATAALLEDEATVQPGEDLADIARRCGVSIATLLAANTALAGGPPAAGTVVKIA